MKATVRRLTARQLGLSLVAVLLSACPDGLTEAVESGDLHIVPSGLTVPLEEVPFDAIGDNRIAFNRGHWLYVVDGRSRTSTSYLGPGLGDRPVIGSVRVSPDASVVAFIAFNFRTTEYGVYAMELGGTEAHRLWEAEDIHPGPPHWAPDGSVIFTSYEQLGPPTHARTLHLRRGVPFDGTAPVFFIFPEADQIFSHPPLAVSPSGAIALIDPNQRRIALFDPAGAPASRDLTTLYQPSGTDSIHSDPVALDWSPTGDEVVFLEEVFRPRGQTGERVATRVMRVPASGGPATLVATVSVTTHSGGASVCWTRDGSTIAFSSPASDAPASVFVVPASGGEPVRFTSTPPDVSDIGVSCF